MARRRFFMTPEMVNQLHPEITGSEAVHICRVLRLSADDTVELFDGTGRFYLARIISATPRQVTLTIEKSFTHATESPVRIILAQAMLKDRKMDDLIRPLTELGIDCWMPFYATRSIPAPEKKRMEKRRSRWEKITVEAVKQCRRACIPDIVPLENFDAVLKAAETCDKKIIFWEDENLAFDQSRIPVQKIMIVVGPEGGFTAEEIKKARDNDFSIAGLGPRILRAETATLAACTLIQYCYGDMGADLSRISG